MTILGYGEDALTLWALSRRLPALLAALGDPGRADDALVLYRPSFGRAATGRAPDASHRAEFGEFDAILGTAAAVYLVESKWDRSGELEGGVLSLRAEQAHRHAVFATYLRLWRELRPSTWEEFARGAEARFGAEHRTVRFAPAGSRLAENLRFVLSALADKGGPIRNVALYFRPEGESPDARVSNEGFECVTLAYEVEPGSRFVRL